MTVVPLPYAFSTVTLQCDGAPCANPELLRRIPMTITVTPNGGLLPASCVDPRIGLWQDSILNGVTIGLPQVTTTAATNVTVASRNGQRGCTCFAIRARYGAAAAASAASAAASGVAPAKAPVASAPARVASKP